MMNSMDTRSRIWILLLLLGFFPTSYLLWTAGKRVDFAIEQRIDAAEQERHAYVISPDFNLLKEKLIEIHRDHWVDEERLESQSRVETACMAGVLLLLSTLLIREFRRTFSPKLPENDDLG
jgi:hypothetical protein